MANRKEMYNIQETVTKAKAVLDKMQKEQKPGQVVEGSKTQVIAAMKGDIEKLMESGYSVQQIADALQNGDIFKILPKSITELVVGKKQKIVKRATAKEIKPKNNDQQITKQTGERKHVQNDEQNDEQKQNKVTSIETTKPDVKPVVDKSKFSIKPDTTDL